MKTEKAKELLKEVSLCLRYSILSKACMLFVLLASPLLLFIIGYSWSINVINDGGNQEHLSSLALIAFCAWSAIYTASYIQQTRYVVYVSMEAIRFGKKKIEWHEVVRVRHSIFFQFLLIESHKTKLVFFPGLQGYDFIVKIAKEASSKET